jgi:putative transposase
MKTQLGKRRQEVEELAQIRQIHEEPHGVNGSRRNAAALERKGLKWSRAKVRKLMKTAGLRSNHPRPYRVTTIQGKERKPKDLVKWSFAAVRPDQVWVSDITYLRTGGGWLYLCVMIDLFSRRVVGWFVDNKTGTELVLDALDQEIRNRRPAPGLVVHSDRGCQYTSRLFRMSLEKKGMRPSMGEVGTC